MCPYLVELAADVGEAAGLSLADGFLVHYVDQVETRHAVGVRDWTGTRLPMHAVSSGLVFLAHLPPSELDRFLAAPRERFTERTVVDAAELRERLRGILRDGYAWTSDEYAEGISSVAAGVADVDGEIVAAIHIHGPSYRFPGASHDEVAVRITAAAATLSARLRNA